MVQYDFSGQTAVVTGGAQGIGLAIVKRLVDAGARVSMWDVDKTGAAAAIKALGDSSQVLACQVDVSDADSVAAASAETLDALGRIDILVNNAGIAGRNATVWDYPIDEWREIIGIDLVGVFLCCRALVPTMRKQGHGRIVNISSIAGKEGNPNASAYSAAKAGVIALTKSLGKELAESGVVCNCVTPAAVKTAIFDQMAPQHIEYMLSKIPIGRFGTVEEIANLVTWLCSSECSFSTGAVFDVSGGRATY